MIKQARFNKKQQVVNELVRQIESGLMEDGYVLPGEQKLAQELGVSRSTLHKALMELERRKYIARRTAGGSVVTFDGIPLDQKNGWAHALASTGARIHTEQLKLEAVDRPELNLQFGMSQFIMLERRRRRDDGTAISLERSLIPATGGLEGLPGVGMIDDSLTITLAAYDASRFQSQKSHAPPIHTRDDCAHLLLYEQTLQLAPVQTGSSVVRSLEQDLSSPSLGTPTQPGGGLRDGPWQRICRSGQPQGLRLGNACPSLYEGHAFKPVCFTLMYLRGRAHSVWRSACHAMHGRQNQVSPAA